MISGLTDKYQHKIKTADELAKMFGPMPRERKVIMCHGVFDVVHPGHLRHLIYAKSKADILVASLTADRHITKGTHRPHVPQDLRALTLAAFELVDYVIIDTNDKPLENLRKIQPDFFAKGYEYNGNVGGLNEKTREEVDVIAGYGGEIIFTPGDIVYSSSKLIESQPPNIGIDKLLMLMDTAGITFESLKVAIAKFDGLKVHVIGDTIVDTFTQCAMIGGQNKTPTMSVLFQERKDYTGGGAVVAEHLRASGSNVVFSTVLGNDALRDFVLEGLNKSGIQVNAVIDHTRPTTNKNTIIAGGYRLLKVDTLDNRSISDDIQGKLADAIFNLKADAVVFSDFRHGIFNRRTIPPLVAAIQPTMFKVADSQVASRWGNITEFQNFDLLTPNEREVRFALADQDSGIRPLASRLYNAANCKMLLMKLGDRGVITCRSEDHEALDSFFVVDSFVRRVIDAVGAGDALLAYATLSMLATKDPVIATIIGSIAAALECEADGNIPIPRDKVLERIVSLEEESLCKR
jgi:rfaE bifunctional protein kinase chain/domain